MKIKLISTGTFVPILSDSICNPLKLGLINLPFIYIVIGEISLPKKWFVIDLFELNS